MALSQLWNYLALLLCGIGNSHACTTLVVGKNASKSGAVLLTHSNDVEANGDARLCWVAAKNHTDGSKRHVYYDKEDYPRYVGYDRSACYIPANGEQPSKPIGAIPEVAHTFAYYEAQYGVMNEHGVGIGETTCSGIFGANASGYGGHALLSVDELSRIAMERSTSARGAVQLMGRLAEEYGFYGVGSFEGSAESLMVGDPDEAFIFHILPDPTGTSAIWVAQRVPDDSVGVVANMFVIRNVDFENAHDFLFSESVRTVAVDQGLWKPSDGPLDFTKLYSDGEYAHKFYSGRRVWGAYRLFGIDLPDDYTDLRLQAGLYPVTAKPSRLVTVQDLFAIHRSYYEGTKFDMTVGLAAGPWGDPDRWTTATSLPGNFERSIGIYRSSTTHVVEARRFGQGAVLWFAPHASASSVFMPFPARGTGVQAPYTVANPNVYDPKSAYWKHRLVFNAAKIKYGYAMKDVRSLQHQLETEGANLVKSLDDAQEGDAESMTQVYAKHAEHIMDVFSALPMQLLAKYADGWQNDQDTLGYPDWWLKAVGYGQGPPPPPPSNRQGRPMVVDSSDESAERCINSCSSNGFSACAKRCLRTTGEIQKSHDVAMSSWNFAMTTGLIGLMIMSVIGVARLIGSFLGKRQEEDLAPYARMKATSSLSSCSTTATSKHSTPQPSSNWSSPGEGYLGA